MAPDAADLLPAYGLPNVLASFYILGSEQYLSIRRDDAFRNRRSFAVNLTAIISQHKKRQAHYRNQADPKPAIGSGVGSRTSFVGFSFHSFGNRNSLVFLALDFFCEELPGARTVLSQVETQSLSRRFVPDESSL